MQLSIDFFRPIRAHARPTLKSLTLVAVCAAIVIGVAPGRVLATTVINRSVQEMTAVSGLVLSGVVLSVEPNQTAPGYPLATRVTIAVDRVFKGFRSGPTIRFMIPGGVRDGKMLMIPGMPSFVEGEEVVVFLERTPHGWIPSGLKNGKYAVHYDQDGRRVVWRDSQGLNRVVPGVSVTRSAEAESDAMTFDDLVDLIEEGLEAEQGGVEPGDDAAVKVPAVDGGAR